MRTVTIPYSSIKHIWPEFLCLVYDGFLSKPPPSLRAFAAQYGFPRRRAKRIVNTFVNARIAIPEKRIKVAFALCKAAEILDLVPSDCTCDYLIERLKLLVASGRVEAFGNINRWRFSEVCRK